ncbi:MAG: type II toxin-antitoxin system HipA family toxin [Desulfobacterales bacterium]|nr:type II toxin-antitoxin system HipA family toxin [Desulfobacterales bacterium]
MDKLNVFINQNRAGELWLDDQRRFCFQYDETWLNSPKSYRLSTCLPLRQDPFLANTPFSYFANLLPEGRILDVLSRKLQISVNNTFELLKAIGGDCAGAVSLYEDNSFPPRPKDYSYAPLTKKRLAKVIETLPDNPFMADEQGIRLSLAGAQEKLPVFLDKDSSIQIAKKGAPSSHILKTPIKELQGSVENETYCMMLAQNMGLLVPEVQIIRVNTIPLYVVKRFDRKIKKGLLYRVIQEDFCQGLNVDPQLKYTPTIQECFSLIRKESASQIRDIRRLLELVIFNGLIGNSDAHAKNISLIHDENGTTLAPFYDLLSTWIYPYAKKMAMKIGGGRHFQFLTPDHFKQFAQDTGIKYRIVKEMVADMSGKITLASKKTTENFCDLYGDSTTVNEVNKVIHQAAQAKISIF